MKAETLAFAGVLVALGGFAIGLTTAPSSKPAAAPAHAAGSTAQPEAKPALPAPPAAPAAPAPAPAAPPKPVAAKPKPAVPKAKPKYELPPLPDVPVLKGAPTLGNRKAAVSVLVVSDFQCPVCRRAAQPVEEIAMELKDDIVVTFVQNPLKMHRRALASAMASAAAHRQGKFWAYHDLVFANQRKLSDSDLLAHARTLKLDLDKWEKDRNDLKLQEQVEAQGAVAANLGARGTPAFFVNGRKQVGWGSKMGLLGQVKRELAATKKLLDQGKSPKEAYEARVRENSSEPEIFLSRFAR